MLVIEKKMLFDENSASATSEVIDINNRGDILLIQVSGTGKFSVYGTSDGETWSVLSAIAMDGFAVGSEIEGEGYYQVSISGVTSIKAVAQSGVGTLKALASICE